MREGREEGMKNLEQYIKTKMEILVLGIYF